MLIQPAGKIFNHKPVAAIKSREFLADKVNAARTLLTGTIPVFNLSPSPGACIPNNQSLMVSDSAIKMADQAPLPIDASWKRLSIRKKIGN